MSTRDVGPATELSAVLVEQPALPRRQSRRAKSATSRLWWPLVVVGILSGWPHHGSARNTANHHVNHATKARVVERATRGIHHARVKSLASSTPRHRQTDPVAQRSMALAKPLIVIDAGHGGRDSGAVGLTGTLEKNVTLATALDLQRLLVATGHYRVAMTRQTDTFIPLGERLAFAQDRSAALLISIHADASNDRHAHGASVYIRSNRPAGSTALPLATNGRAATTAAQTLAGNVPQRETGSPLLQNTMIDNLDDDIRMAADPARRARLFVLATGHIPSVLLEMGFLSNRHDESLLKQHAHRNVVAKAVRDAIDDYFDGMQHPRGGRT